MKCFERQFLGNCVRFFRRINRPFQIARYFTRFTKKKNEKSFFFAEIPRDIVFISSNFQETQTKYFWSVNIVNSWGSNNNSEVVFSVLIRHQLNELAILNYKKRSNWWIEINEIFWANTFKLLHWNFFK